MTLSPVLALDLLLLLGFTLRLTRLVIADDLGLWTIRGPAYLWATKHEPDAGGWRAKLVSGLSCPFCVGFWIGALTVVSLLVAYAVPDVLLWPWRIVAGIMTLNWIVGHVAGRVGDTDTD